MVEGCGRQVRAAARIVTREGKLGVYEEMERLVAGPSGETADNDNQAPARMPAAVLAPPCYCIASAPVPQPKHSADRLHIPEIVLEF